MKAVNLLHRQAELLEHWLGYRAEEMRSELDSTSASLDPFTIALGRDVGTPAAEVAREIEQRIGWTVHDREVPLRIARKLNLPPGLIEQIDEKRRSWLLECLEALSPNQTLSEGQYFRCLLEVIRSLGEKGSCVIVGRGAGFILPARTTLRVRLVGDAADRIAALSRELQLDRSAAARKVQELTRERSRFLREHFLVDPSKARNYDLILNCSQWTPGDCADFIVQALKYKAAGITMA